MKVFHGTSSYNLYTFLTGKPRMKIYPHIPNGRIGFCASLSFNEAALFALRKTPISNLTKTGIIIEFELRGKEDKDYIFVKDAQAIRDENEVAIFNVEKIEMVAHWKLKKGEWIRIEVIKESQEKDEKYKFTHHDLEVLGAYWLRRAQYNIVDWESAFCTSSPFLPDVVGLKYLDQWEHGHHDPKSTNYHFTIIEVKISRSDWKSASQKRKEQFAEAGQYANQHYILCPSGMIDKSELYPGWGLLTIRRNGFPACLKRARNIKIKWDSWKVPIGKIMMNYATIGIASRLKEIGINYWGRFIEPDSQLDRLQKDIVRHTKKQKDGEKNGNDRNKT